jgi:hypothetical protein
MIIDSLIVDSYTKRAKVNPKKMQEMENIFIVGSPVLMDEKMWVTLSPTGEGVGVRERKRKREGWYRMFTEIASGS